MTTAPPPSPKPTAPQTSPAPSRARRPVPAPGPVRAAVSIVLAVVLALIVWFFAAPVAGLDLHAASMSIKPGSIIPAVVVPGVLAWVLRLILAEEQRGAMIWTIIASAVLVLSLLIPLTAGGIAILVLLVMHLLAGAALILGLRSGPTPQHTSRTPVDSGPSA